MFTVTVSTPCFFEFLGLLNEFFLEEAWFLGGGGGLGLGLGVAKVRLPAH